MNAIGPEALRLRHALRNHLTTTVLLWEIEEIIHPHALMALIAEDLTLFTSGLARVAPRILGADLAIGLSAA